MPNRKLLAIVTVFLNLVSGDFAQDTYTIDQLREVERLVTSRNCGGLQTFLADNPVLTAGQDALAVELRTFMSNVNFGLIDCLAQEAEPQTAIAQNFASTEIY